MSQQIHLPTTLTFRLAPSPAPGSYLVVIDNLEVAAGAGGDFVINLAEIKVAQAGIALPTRSQALSSSDFEDNWIGLCFDNIFDNMCHTGLGDNATSLRFVVDSEFDEIIIWNRVDTEWRFRIVGATVTVYDRSDLSSPVWLATFDGELEAYNFNVVAPTAMPSVAPTAAPSAGPTAAPSVGPTAAPTAVPTAGATAAQTMSPTAVPTMTQSMAPTATQVYVESFTSTCDCSACPVFTAALCGAGTGACAAEYGLPNPVCQPGATDFTCVISEDESCDNGESCASNCGLFGCSESHYTCIPNTPSEEHMDGAALCGLVHSTNMHNVANDWTCKGAGPNTPPCGNMEHPPWRGITCNPDDRVTEISWQFTDYFVQGHIDSSIRHLTEVVFLDFHHQLLKGPIEAELGNLPKLQYLDLSVNLFTGRLPHTFRHLKERGVEFKLRGNQLDNHKNHA